MFSSLRLARSRSQGSTAGCAGEKESAVNGDTDRHVDRHVYQVTPQGLSSCPTSPLLSGKPPRPPQPRPQGLLEMGLDRALCPSIGSLRERASRWDDDLGLGTPSSSSDVCTCSKVTRVAVARQDGCLGITVRGGSPQPLIITSVHPGGPADREGSIRPGDRLLAVDGTNLQLADLSTAHSTLRGHQAQSVAVLTIEYSVCVVGAVVGAQGPLLVELARPPAHQLGITLRSSRGPDRRPIVVVDDIKPASVADRSGALHRGDQILAVDEVRVDGTDLNASDVTTLLAEGGAAGSVLRLEVLPAHCLPTGSPQQFCGHQRSPCPSESGLSAYNAVRSLRSYDNGSLASSTAGSGSAAPSAGIVSHTETLAVVLRPEPLSGYGLAVRASGASRIPTISALHPDGPAAKSGCLQVGDRVVAVDEREVDAERLARLLDSPGPPVTLRVSFSVAESVVPASGVFTVKLAKYRPGLGITITGNKTGEYLHISDIKRGSVAHRSGTLAVGDRLLEIDGLSLGAGLSGGRDLGRALDHAARILHNSGEVVTLKVFKDETPSEIDSNWGGWSGSLRGPLSGGWTDNWTRSIEYPLESIVGHHAGPVEYTVELVRHGGPLGLTIAGSEDPSDSVTISGLTPGGLAEQTGALHVGDRLMAINGESLRGRRLSEAIAMFQNSADVVTLKISRTPQGHANLGRRPTPDRKGLPNCEHPGISSVDSALESWESSTSQHDSSPAGKGFSNPPGCSAVNGAGAGSGRGADGAQAAKVKLTPLPLSPPTSNPAPLPRRSGSCPSLDCLLQTEAAGNNPEWDESLEDLDSAAATAASLSMRQEELDASPTSPSISPPADFRLGFEPAWRQTGLGDPGPGRPPETVTSSPARGWPRPPPFPTPSTRLTAAKALNNDWRQRQQRSDTVDSQAISPKLTSFQWTTANGTPVGTPLETTRGDRDEPGSGSLRNLDFSVLNRSLQRVHYDFGVQADAEANLRASSLLLEEEATDALHLHELGLQQSTELYRVTIYKDTVYEDFGFSVSDGLYERGVFINRIRKGGPADATGVLCPYDRILQVNDTRTHDFDCCLTVPLIAAAGDRIQLIVARNPDTAYQLPLEGSHLGSNTVTKAI